MSQEISKQSVSEEVKDIDSSPQFAQFLGEDWSQLLAKLQGVNNQRNAHYLMQEVAPVLLQALAELIKAHEREQELIEENKKQMKKNPSIKARREFNSLHWLASYLARHNPKYVPLQEKETLAYSAVIAELLPK